MAHRLKVLSLYRAVSPPPYGNIKDSVLRSSNQKGSQERSKKEGKGG